MNCTNCKSDRIASITGKCSDLSFFSVGVQDHEGYVPENVGIGGDDYIEFDYCLDCGTIQGKFPITKKAVKDAFK